MKKKIIALCVCIAMLAIALIGGTMAYFTDTKTETNVMTAGRVKIVLNEEKRGDNGMEKFDSSAITLMPMVYNENKAETNYVTDSNAKVSVFSDRFANVVDKFVSVTNDGGDDTYVRVLFAFEGTYAEVEDYIGYLVNDSEECDFSFVHEGYDAKGKLINARGVLAPDNSVWTIAEAVYPVALEKDKTSPYSLKQIFLAPSATAKGFAEHFGTNYEIKVLAQATQKAGFDTAREALNISFGNVQAAVGDADFVKDETLIEWFGLGTTTP